MASMPQRCQALGATDWKSVILQAELVATVRRTSSPSIRGCCWSAVSFGRGDSRRVRDLCVTSDHGKPWTHFPFPNQSVVNVGIGLGEFPGRLGGVTLKQEHCLIGWFTECSPQNQFSPLDCGLGESQVFASVLRAPLEIVFGNLVDEQVVHWTRSESELSAETGMARAGGALAGAELGARARSRLPLIMV